MNEEVDLQRYPNARALLETSQRFLSEIKDLTPGHKLEAYLNQNYGPGNQIYDDISKYIKLGFQEGWCANVEIDGPKFRRSKFRLPCEDTRFLSITTAYMQSQDEYSGQYHLHPYGEINCVVPLDDTAQLRGLQEWRGAGWTSPGPGTHHYPKVRNGALVALVFLPAGRVSYDVSPEEPQPDCI